MLKHRLVIDTTAVIPMTGQLAFNHLRTRTADSVRIVAGRSELKGGIKPSTSDKLTPTAAAVISIDTLKYISMPLRTGLSLTGSSFTIEALPIVMHDAYRWQNRQRRTLTNEQRVHLTEKKKKMAGKTAVGDSSKTEGQFLRKWEARGSISFKQMRGFSRMFPSPIWMDADDDEFQHKRHHTDRCPPALGNNFTLNGEISRIRKAMLRGGKLKGNFNPNSDYIDCNQLMQAVNNGMQYGENTDLLMLSDENIADNSIPNRCEDSIAQTETDTTSQLFVLQPFSTWLSIRMQNVSISRIWN